MTSERDPRKELALPVIYECLETGEEFTIYFSFLADVPPDIINCKFHEQPHNAKIIKITGEKVSVEIEKIVYSLDYEDKDK